MQEHPLSITAKEIHDLIGTDTPLILEIGCHEGSDTLKLLEEMPSATIHCFEPDDRPVQRFRGTFIDNAAVTLFPVAVGDIDGYAPFHASTGPAGNSEDWDYSGSLNKPTGHYQRSPEIAYKEPSPVACVRLDTWTERSRRDPILFFPGPIDFVWADIQGSHRKFIAGALETLKVIRYLYIECHTTPLYEGEPSHEELIALLPDFEPIAVYERENILFRNKAIA